MTKEKNEHAGHRKRLKERYKKEGLNNFEPHQVLELMLFYCMAQADTNPLAHNLIREFGSFSGVISADEKDLVKIAGIGEHTAVFLTMIPELMRYYAKDLQRSRPAIRNISEAGEFFTKLFMGERNEKIYLASLDMRSRINNISLIAEGTVAEVPLYARKVLEEVLKNNAVKVVLAHNHPGGSPKPSMEDIELTKQCISFLNPIKVRLLDHIIVCDTGYTSFTASKIITNQGSSADDAYAAQYEYDE